MLEIKGMSDFDLVYLYKDSIRRAVRHENGPDSITGDESPQSLIRRTEQEILRRLRERNQQPGS